MSSGGPGRLDVCIDQVSFGVLVNAVPRDVVDDAVVVCGVREKRSDGKLPAHVITYLTLALCLFPDEDYEEVATRVTGSLDRWGCWNAAWSVPSASAITQARKRWGSSAGQPHPCRTAQALEPDSSADQELPDMTSRAGLSVQLPGGVSSKRHSGSPPCHDG
ncbi:MAG: transposase domain-containing protein [Pseudonocardiaceae bacterium]